MPSGSMPFGVRGRSTPRCRSSRFQAGSDICLDVPAISGQISSTNKQEKCIGLQACLKHRSSNLFMLQLIAKTSLLNHAGPPHVHIGNERNEYGGHTCYYGSRACTRKKADCE